MSAFPTSISGTFKHEVVITMTAPQVLETLNPEIQKIAVASARDVLSRYVKEMLPELPSPESVG